MEENFNEVLRSPLSILVCMLVGIPLFALGAANMGSMMNIMLTTSIDLSKGLVLSVALTLIGLISLSFGFIGLGEAIIDKELIEKGFM